MGLAAETLQSGTILSRYRIVQKLGQGGMGEVYKAVDLELESPVALKLLPPWAASDPANKQHLLREARLARSINHPNIVTIYSVDRAEDIDFIVMEFVEGETLYDLLRDGPLELSQILDIGTQLAGALAAAHEIGLLHRDVKPANIVITPRGQAKMLDFGIAKRLAPELNTAFETALFENTSREMVKGTIPYMSPEQARGEPLDGRSDLFSLGSVLYECATGQRPFRGSEIRAIVHEITSIEPPPPSRVRPDLHFGLDPILARAMAKDRARRFDSGMEMAQALGSLMEGRAVPTGPVLRASVGRTEIPNNLPTQLTSFVGREREVADIKRLLGSSPLVSLTGPGGCGKTRLAIRVGQDLLPECADGVWFVDLAPLSDPELVPQAMAAVLSVREQPGKSLNDTLADFLVGKSLLLVLDNCEHLVRACAGLVKHLLYECPGIHVLVTSREALRVPGEAVWRTPSLSVPPENAAGRSIRIAEYESVQLFLARAEAAHTPFALEKQTAIVGQICQRLDGIPLAIELAAARAGALAPQDILARLEDRFRLLSWDGAVGRQRTLAATIDWSYDLLSEDERTLFRRLGVFAGTFDLDAAESVCSSSGLERHDVLDLVVRLVEKSLLMAEENIGGSGRYRLPETLRAYAREKLRTAGEEESAWSRHRDHFLSLVESAEPQLQGPDQARWFRRLDADHEDIRIALRHALESKDRAVACRFCASIWRFWWVYGMWSEGRDRMRAALALCDENSSEVQRVKILHGAAVLARGQGDYDEAERLLARGLALARGQSDQRGTATMLHELANIANERGDLPKARSLYEESLGLWRKLGDKRGISSVVHNLGVVAQSQRDYKAAQRLYEEALVIHRELRNPAWEAAGLNGLGSVALARSDLAVARSCHEQAVTIQKELGDLRGMGFSLRELGIVSERTGELTRARGLLADSLRILRDLSDREGIAESLESLVGLAVAQAQPDRALRLAGAAWALRELIGSPLMPVDRERLDACLRQAKQALGKDAAARAYAEGRAFPFERAVQYGLEEESGPVMSHMS